MKAIVEVKNVNFSYEKEIPFLCDLSFEIKKNSYNVIVGHNGSGKTTIAKLLCGLEKVDSGLISIDGLTLNPNNIDLIRKKIGIIFQNPDNQFIASNVKDDIIFGLENHGIEPNKMDEIVQNISFLCKIEPFLNREPQTLSGGEKQRVAMAAVLALNPKIIILDEAHSMLDPKSKKEFKDLILKLKDEMKLTVISITHDINETLLADNIILLDKGKIAFSGNKKDFYNLDFNKYKLCYPAIIDFQKKLNFSSLEIDEDLVIKKVKGVRI